MTLNVKLWPRLKINRWPSYGLVTMCNIMGICVFYKSVANRHRWLTYMDGQFHSFYCINLFLSDTKEFCFCSSLQLCNSHLHPVFAQDMVLYAHDIEWQSCLWAPERMVPAYVRALVVLKLQWIFHSRFLSGSLDKPKKNIKCRCGSHSSAL